MSNFAIAVAAVLAAEGGYVDDPADPGGATKYGICQRDHPGVDIAALTEDQAAEIYRQGYWSPFAEQFPQRIATSWFLAAVNMGPAPATRLLQTAIGRCGVTVGVDGVLGRETGTAAAVIGADVLLPAYQAAQIDHYRQIANDNPALAKFLAGWINRVTSVA